MTFAVKSYTLLGADGLPYQSPQKGRWGGHRKGKVFGRLDCPAALHWISRGHYVRHRVFFTTMADAIDAGYRPCHTCLPAEYRQWKADPEAYMAQLPVRGAFHWEEMLRHLARSPPSRGHQVSAGRLSKFFALPGGPALIAIEEQPEGLVLRCRNRRPAPAEKRALRQWIADWQAYATFYLWHTLLPHS